MAEKSESSEQVLDPNFIYPDSNDISEEENLEDEVFKMCLFRFQQEDKIIGFADDKIFCFDLSHRLLSQLKCKFDYSSRYPQCSPLLLEENEKIGIFDSRLYKMTSTSIQLLKKFKYEISQFYCCYDETIIFQDLQTFQFKVLKKDQSIQKCQKLNKLKLKEPCGLCCHQKKIYVIPRFSPKYYELQKEEVKELKIEKKGVQMILRGIYQNKAMLEIDFQFFQMELGTTMMEIVTENEFRKMVEAM